MRTNKSLFTPAKKLSSEYGVYPFSPSKGVTLICNRRKWISPTGKKRSGSFWHATWKVNVLRRRNRAWRNGSVPTLTGSTCCNNLSAYGMLLRKPGTAKQWTKRLSRRTGSDFEAKWGRRPFQAPRRRPTPHRTTTDVSSAEPPKELPPRLQHCTDVTNHTPATESRPRQRMCPATGQVFFFHVYQT